MVDITRVEKLFDLSEAKALLPLIMKITLKHQQKLGPIQNRLERMLSNDPRRKFIEREFAEIISSWRTKLESLGVRTSDLWLVGFDVGEGLLSWKHPELCLSHFVLHDFPQERLNLSNYINERDPDWAR